MDTWFSFFDYVSKCGYKLAVHGPATICRCAVLSQQNVFCLFVVVFVFFPPRKLDQTFKNVEISHQNLDLKVFLKMLRQWHSGRLCIPRQPARGVGGLSYWIVSSSVYQSHLCCLLSSWRGDWVSVTTHLCNCKWSLIIQKYLAETMSLANDRKKKTWNG